MTRGISGSVLALGLSLGCSSPGDGDGAANSGGSGGAMGGASTGGSTGGGGGSSGTGGSTPLAGAAGSSASAAAGAAAGTAGGTSGSCAPLPLTAASAAKIRTVAYLPTYRGALAVLAGQLDFAKLSYVDIAFASVDAGGNFSLLDSGLCEFTNAAHAAGVKVCVAVGGAVTMDTSEGMGKYTALMDPAARGAFIDKITRFLGESNLDCIDLDYESQNLGTDYAGFVSALSTALKTQGKEVSTAVGRWFGNAQLTAALPHFDFVNVMAYDMCPFWAGTPCDHSEIGEVQNEEMAYWLSQGLPASKAVLGVPFYGYEWQGGTGQALTYAEIVATYGAAADNDWIESGDVTVVHNGLATIKAKAALAKASYGGIMIWELMQDAPGASSLLAGIDSAL
jgi:chitinase